MKTKRIAVLGLGQFGGSLAQELALLGCEVLAIDSNEARVQEVRDAVTSAAIADVREREALSELINAPFDIGVVATGGALEAAILAVLHLKELGVSDVWAEAPNDDGAEVLRRVGADRIFSPERDAGRRLAQRLANPNMVEFLPVMKGYGICEVEAPSFTHGRTLAELDLRNKRGLAIVAVRGQSSATMVPTAATTIVEGDVIVVVGKDADIAKFRETE